MEYFDIRKMPVNLWRNGAGETREICCFPPATRDFHWRASIASIATNGEFARFPGMERVVTLLEGGEIHLESTDSFSHTLKQLQPFAFSGEQIVKAQLNEGQMSMDFNIMTRCNSCKAKVRIADRTFTTFGSRGGVVFVISGIWQLGDKVLTTDQGACWYDGKHTLRLLQSTGKLLFSEISWLPGYSPDQVQ
ncbi:environmental stress-induced protein Ves [Escherichia fergusonii]|uniref:environmental stress-induced protein Ves n=1 Tax=Escherichia fergusonii TaxID=564 RepID=UPI001CC09427|nr:environmental stress-induced protein Ves [Escherichia fergusonii]MBZ4076127.1 environmental stress-induced protein Ves [Escherichia fergusonii]MBZ4106681.1 environmental stress-induced protein Ves [Escherichia fergusonii]MBZ4112266.1 environmental stress-induced protein Ves [Escherichia fergusonii]MBZ4121381.1 environmental stress-induced protein Ves [Escherichia fergusonii]MBZ4124835.1 environmental stress-induced protein Ves [Escherichia fergusonii]